MRILLILSILFSCSFALKASEQLNFYVPLELDQTIQLGDFQVNGDNTVVVKPKFKKLKAILLAIFLGHFGVHRIYLGTGANVPVVYSLTLGGGFGLLPLLDIIAILTTDDLVKYSNNNRVFMWSKAKE